MPALAAAHPVGSFQAIPFRVGSSSSRGKRYRAARTHHPASSHGNEAPRLLRLQRGQVRRRRYTRASAASLWTPLQFPIPLQRARTATGPLSLSPFADRRGRETAGAFWRGNCPTSPVSLSARFLHKSESPSTDLRPNLGRARYLLRILRSADPPPMRKRPHRLSFLSARRVLPRPLHLDQLIAVPRPTLAPLN
jgi:hypothetical protein